MEVLTHSAQGQGRSASQHYPVMNFEDIAGLPVAESIAESAFLVLSVPFPHLPLGLQLIGRSGSLLGFSVRLGEAEQNQAGLGDGYWLWHSEERRAVAARPPGQATPSAAEVPQRP